MVQIKDKVGKIVEVLSMFAAKGGSQALFNPLKLVSMPLKKDPERFMLRTSMQANGNVAILTGVYASIGLDGKGSFVLDADKVVKLLSVFSSEEEIVMDAKADKIRFIGKTDEATYYPPDEMYVKEHFLEKIPFTIKEGVAWYHGGSEKPATHVIIDSKELQKLITRAGIVGVDYYQFHFGSDGCWCLVGDMADKTLTPIKTKLDCEVIGPDLDVSLSAGFHEIIGVLDGVWQLWASTNSPVWLYRAVPEYRVGYQLAPRVVE